MKSIKVDFINPSFESFKAFKFCDQFSANIFIIDTNHFLSCLVYCKSLLNISDITYATKMKMESDINRKIIGRAILKILLSSILDQPVQLIEIKKDDFGKPFCKEAINQNIHFSISDSSSFVCIIIGESMVGVDIELMRTDFQFHDIAQTHFHPSELAQLQLTQDQLALFYLFWTRKESFLKQEGRGLNVDLSLLDMTSGEKIVHLTDLNQHNKICIHGFYINPTLIGAVAVAETTKQLRFFNYLAVDLDQH